MNLHEGRLISNKAGKQNWVGDGSFLKHKQNDPKNTLYLLTSLLSFEKSRCSVWKLCIYCMSENNTWKTETFQEAVEQSRNFFFFAVNVELGLALYIN